MDNAIVVAIIKEKPTSPLLHHLKGGAKNSSADIAAGLEQATTETVEPTVKVTALWDDLEFIFVIGDDLSQFLLNQFGVAGLTSKSG